jgi:hypothetical protein
MTLAMIEQKSVILFRLVLKGQSGHLAIGGSYLQHYSN